MGILVENRFPQGSMQSPGDGVVLNEYFSSVVTVEKSQELGNSGK